MDQCRNSPPEAAAPGRANPSAKRTGSPEGPATGAGVGKLLPFAEPNSLVHKMKGLD